MPHPRLVGVEKKTVLRVLVHAGELCQRVMNKRLRHLSLEYIQADELYTYVGKREINILPTDRRNRGPHIGETWVFLATDGPTKLVPTFAVGPRDLPTAERFMVDLAGRLAFRPQLSTDGLRAYLWAVERAFGSNVDYGMLIKQYSGEVGSLELSSSLPRTVTGKPDPRHISTSYAERNNLNCRTFTRRLTRLTNGFSKKLDNLISALWLYFAHYNFVRIHGTLRMTPAMAANVTDHLWTIEELLNSGASS